MSDRRVVWVITHTVAIAIAWVGAGVVVGVRVGARCGSGIRLAIIATTGQADLISSSSATRYTVLIRRRLTARYILRSLAQE